MSQSLPKHIAIIMDGNGRWAKRRQLSRIAGHKAGVASVREVVEVCGEHNIEVLSLFAFSSENWRRPAAEVKALMELFARSLGSEVKKLHENGVQLRFIGELSQFSKKLQKSMQAATELTKNNKNLTLVIGVNYGGQWDILQATQQLAQQVADGKITPDAIDHDYFAKHLTMADLPDPDLFIRTSGEQRISNFFLWQLAYSELYFTDACWPDFKRAELEAALDYFANRERRFGHTSEQLEQMEYA